MNLEELPDAELNKMIAETTGIVPQHDMAIMSEYSGATCSKCHKAQVYILRDKSPCLPLDYCNSAEAQAELEKCLDAKLQSWIMSSDMQNGKRIYTVEIEDEKMLFGAANAATKGRALCEAFYRAFGSKEEQDERKPQQD